jgi:hypothetical protein
MYVHRKVMYTASLNRWTLCVRAKFRVLIWRLWTIHSRVHPLPQPKKRAYNSGCVPHEYKYPIEKYRVYKIPLVKERGVGGHPRELT